MRAPSPRPGRKPERHFRQLQGVRTKPQHSVEPYSAVEQRKINRDEQRRFKRGLSR